MKTRMRRRLVLAVASAMISGGAAFAAEPTNPAPTDPSPEQRHKMAEIHLRMADCLVSARPMTECRSEMQTSCSAMVGQGGCSTMNGGMMHGRGMGMNPGAPSKETPGDAPDQHGH